MSTSEPNVEQLSPDALLELLQRTPRDPEAPALMAQDALLSRYGITIDPERVNQRLADKLLMAAVLFGRLP